MTLHDFLKNHSNLLTTKTNAILYPYRPLKDNLNIKSPSSRTEIKGLGDQTFGGELVQGAVCPSYACGYMFDDAERRVCSCRSDSR